MAVINHLGTLGSGHYTTIARERGKFSWVHCDDRTVISCRKESLNSASAYMLFYEQVEM